MVSRLVGVALLTVGLAVGSAQEEIYRMGGGAFRYLAFATDGVDRITVTPQGDVGIGTRTPNYLGLPRMLTIQSDNASTPPGIEIVSARADTANGLIATLESRNTTQAIGHQRMAAIISSMMGATATQRGGTIALWTKPNGGTTIVERLRADHEGQILIANLAGTGNRAVYSDPTGYLTNSASDGSLKTNITPITDATALARRLRGVRFQWRDGTRRGPQVEMGFVAQEVATVAPEVVGRNADGMLSVDYPKLTAVLAEAFEELDARVARLETKRKQ